MKDEKSRAGPRVEIMIGMLEDAVDSRTCDACYKEYCDSETCTHGEDPEWMDYTVYHFAQDGSSDMVSNAKKGLATVNERPILTKEVMLQRVADSKEENAWGSEEQGHHEQEAREKDARFAAFMMEKEDESPSKRQKAAEGSEQESGDDSDTDPGDSGPSDDEAV